MLRPLSFLVTSAHYDPSRDDGAMGKHSSEVASSFPSAEPQRSRVKPLEGWVGTRYGIQSPEALFVAWLLTLENV